MAGRPPGPNPHFQLDTRLGLATGGLLAVCILLMGIPDGLSWQNVGRLVFDFTGAQAFIATTQWFYLFAFASVILLVRFRLAIAVLRYQNPFLLLLISYLFLNTSWSVDPDISIRRSIKFLGAFVICLAFTVASWRPGRMEVVVRHAMLFYLLASLVFIVVMPKYGIHQVEGENEPQLAGAWRGLGTHKNGFGGVSAFALVFWMHAWFTTTGERLKTGFAIVVALVCLIGARSSTSLACAVVSTAVIYAALRYPLARRPLWMLAAVALLVLLPLMAFVIPNGWPTLDDLLKPLVTLLGRDLTFTNRDKLWGALLLEIPNHPWLGIGYQAFWNGPGSASDAALKYAGFIVNSGHSGYLDIINELGIVGFSLLMLMILTDLRRLFVLSVVSLTFFALHLGLNVFQLMVNISESFFMGTMTMSSFLVLLSSVVTSRMRFEQDLWRLQQEKRPL